MHELQGWGYLRREQSRTTLRLYGDETVKELCVNTVRPAADTAADGAAAVDGAAASDDSAPPTTTMPKGMRAGTQQARVWELLARRFGAEMLRNEARANFDPLQLGAAGLQFYSSTHCAAQAGARSCTSSGCRSPCSASADAGAATPPTWVPGRRGRHEHPGDLMVLRLRS